MKEKEEILKEIVKEINEPLLKYKEHKKRKGLFLKVKHFNEELDKFLLPEKDSFIANFTLNKKTDDEFKRYTLFWINERAKYLWDNSQKSATEEELKGLHFIIKKSKQMIDDLDAYEKAKKQNLN